eukprot:681656-Amphidinium_carterae.1
MEGDVSLCTLSKDAVGVRVNFKKADFDAPALNDAIGRVFITAGPRLELTRGLSRAITMMTRLKMLAP